MTTETETADEVTRRASDRWALIAFGAIEVCALPLLLVFGRHDWFTLDDWDFLSARTAGNLGDWFRAHFQHWVMLPMLVYRLVWVFVGLRSYMPYLTVLIVGHLLIAALLRVVMRRAGVNPWLATVAAGGFVVFGAGAENILVAFQITFVGALGFGLVQLVLADHDGPLGRRDQLGLLAGFLGLLCSGVAVVMTVVVGMAVLLRRGWKGRRIAAFHTLPLAVVYAAWSVFAPKGQRATVLQSHSPVSVTKFVLVGIEAAFAGLGQLPGVGIALGLLLAGGLVFTLRTEGRSALRGRRAVPMALLAGALVFLVLTGAARAGEGPLVIAIKHSGTERARDSRYIYTVGAMCLPALALAGDLLMRRAKWLAIPVVALLVAGVPANVHQLDNYHQVYPIPRSLRVAILSMPRLPLADQLHGSKAPYPFRPLQTEGLTLGWLVDSFSSGRIPEPPGGLINRVSRRQLVFFLSPSVASPNIRCVPLRSARSTVLNKGESITLEGGAVSIVYTPPGRPPNLAVRFDPLTYTALAGPLHLRMTPRAPGESVCQ